MEQRSDSEQKAPPFVPATNVQQNLLQLLRSRQAAAAATSAGLPQGLHQYSPALAHGVDGVAAAHTAADRSAAFSAATTQQSEKPEGGIPQNMAYWQNFAHLHAARGGLPVIQRPALSQPMAVALDQWYLAASQPNRAAMAAAAAMAFQLHHHHPPVVPTPPVIAPNIRDWLDDTDPVFDLSGSRDRPAAAQSKRRKLDEDFGSNGAEEGSAAKEDVVEAQTAGASHQGSSSSSSSLQAFSTPQRPPRQLGAVKTPLSVASISEYDPRSMTASIVAPPVELGPQLSKLYALLRDQQKSDNADGLRELASQSPRAVSKRIREVMNFEFELSQDEAREIQRGKALGILDA